MQKNKLEELKLLIQKSHDSAIAAIDQLIKNCSEIKPSGGNPPVPVPVVYSSNNIYEIAEDVIKSSTKDFRVDDILQELRARGKKYNSDNARIISQVINKFRQRNPPEVVVIENGRGRRSGIYRYKNPRL